MKKWVLLNKLYFFGVLFGAIAGFLYFKYVGCINGTCLITSTPYRSTLYGAFVAAILFGVFAREEKKLPKKL